MDIFENVVYCGYGNPLACFLLLALLYPVLYLAFRICGKLSVSARGWHAGSVYSRGRVVLSALRLFSFFQPLLRLESFAFRHVSDWRGIGKREPKVSDVVVEVVHIT
jgi:hypothetical protein